MSNLNADSTKFVSLFREKVFKEEHFVSTLLRLLSQEGVSKINELDLERKLLAYYRNPAYKELFQDVVLASDLFGQKVDLRNGFYREKYFGAGVWFKSTKADDLYLIPDAIEDLPYFESSLSEDGKIKIRQVASHLGIRYAVEKISSVPLTIYGVNPNGKQFLHSGIHKSNHLSFELLTDGEVSDIQTVDTKGMEHIFYQSPYSMNDAICFENLKEICFSLNGASFALKRGLRNGEVCYSILNTEVIDKNILMQLALIANQKYDESSFYDTNEAPYVRKITLK